MASNGFDEEVMAATIADVARRAGVAASTVSYVLNGGPRKVTPELSERVQSAIVELDYRPSRIARSMVTRRSGAYGVIAPRYASNLIGGSFVQTVLNEIILQSRERRHDILVYTNALSDDPERALADVDDGRSDGILAIGKGQEARLIDLVASRDIPLVMIGGWPRASTVYVGSDNNAGIAQVITHLVRLGHRRIGSVYGDRLIKDADERYRATRHYLALHGLPVNEAWFAEGQFLQSTTRRAARQILSCEDRPTALIVSNDESAGTVLTCAADLGLRVPEDLSIVGYDDIPLAQLTHPPLTTVAQPLAEIVRIALLRLEDRIAGRTVPATTILPTALIERATTSCPTKDSYEN